MLDSNIVLSTFQSTSTTQRGLMSLNSGVRFSRLAWLRWWLVLGTFVSSITFCTCSAHTASCFGYGSSMSMRCAAVAGIAFGEANGQPATQDVLHYAVEQFGAGRAG